jgi:hypothetical protein
MSNGLGYEIITALLPEGDVWSPKVDGDLDLVQQADGEILDTMISTAQEIGFFRDPLLTPILDDLEREFGILKNSNISEELRRQQLNAKKFRIDIDGTATDLQDALDAAGFDLQVHKNNPPVDPAIFLTQNFQMVAGGVDSVAGNENAFAGLLGGYLLVNGPTYLQTPAYDMQAGGLNSVSGNAEAVAGHFLRLQKNAIEYTIPVDPNNWGYVFYVGGDATRNVSGELTKIEQGLVPTERINELETIILSIKPLFSWAAMIITKT